MTLITHSLPFLKTTHQEGLYGLIMWTLPFPSHLGSQGCSGHGVWGGHVYPFILPHSCEVHPGANRLKGGVAQVKAGFLGEGSSTCYFFPGESRVPLWPVPVH